MSEISKLNGYDIKDSTARNNIEILNLDRIKIFEDVLSMKSDTTLQEGMKIKTLGFYNYNDGGGSYYKVRTITNNDVVDESFIIALYDDSLIAELIIDDKKISLLQIGCKSDGTNDCTSKIYTAINKLKDGGEIYIPTGKYDVTKISIDFAVKNLTITGQGFDSYLYNNNNDWCIEFEQYIEDVLLNNFAIWCNNVGKGIKTNTDENGINTRLRFNNFKIRNTTNGLYLENVAYCEMNNSQIGVTSSNNNSSNNYAVLLNGREYNTFNTCSFNADTNGSIFSLFKIIQSNYDTFINCEFAKSEKAIDIDTTSSSKTLNNLTIDKCKFAFIGKCFYAYINQRALVNVKIINNIMYTTGTSANDRPILIEKVSGSTQTVQNIIIENNLFNKESGTSPSYCIECVDNIMLNASILNNRSMFNNNNYLNIGQNVLAQFSDMNVSQIKNYTITGDGTTTKFTIYNNQDILPVLSIVPNALVNVKSLDIPYSVRTEYGGSSGKELRVILNFTSPPPVGNYDIDYKIRY